MGDKIDKALDFFTKGNDIILGVEGIISEAVEDKDKRNEFNVKLAEFRTKLQIAFAQVKTHPILDGLYKLGSHITNWYALTIVGAAWLFKGHTFTIDEVGLILGICGLYQARKGYQTKIEANK